MRQKIHGLPNHPEQNTLKEYSAEIPEGTYQVHLDHHAWGKSTNLFCYFTDVASSEKYRLSVFSRGGYKPYSDGPAFDEEPIGGTFKITTATSKNGLPKFMSAAKIEF